MVIPQNICIPLITLGIGTWKSREDYTNHISYDNLIIIVSIPDILPGTVRVGNDRYVLRVDRKGDECQGYYDNCWYKKEGKAAQHPPNQNVFRGPENGRRVFVGLLFLLDKGGLRLLPSGPYRRRILLDL